MKNARPNANIETKILNAKTLIRCTIRESPRPFTLKITMLETARRKIPVRRIIILIYLIIMSLEMSSTRPSPVKYRAATSGDTTMPMRRQSIPSMRVHDRAIL